MWRCQGPKWGEDSTPDRRRPVPAAERERQPGPGPWSMAPPHQSGAPGGNLPQDLRLMWLRFARLNNTRSWREKGVGWAHHTCTYTTAILCRNSASRNPDRSLKKAPIIPPSISAHPDVCWIDQPTSSLCGHWRLVG